MGFGSSIAQGAQSENAQTNEQIFMRLPAEAVIRILDTEEFTYWRYYMYVNVGGKQAQRSIVVGPGDTPIKKHFDKFERDDPKRAKPGKRMLLNVLDRTPVKSVNGTPVYPTTGNMFPTQGPNGENITGIPIEPNNKVYILDFGADLMGKFTVYHQRVRNQKTFEPMNIWDFDVRIVSTFGKEPKDVQRNVIPDLDQEPLPEELKKNLLKFDLSQVVHPMPDEMQVRLLAGEDLLGILKELNWARPQATIKL